MYENKTEDIGHVIAYCRGECCCWVGRAFGVSLVAMPGVGVNTIRIALISSGLCSPLVRHAVQLDLLCLVNATALLNLLLLVFYRVHFM